VLKAMFRNALVIGIALGFAVNLPGCAARALWQALEMIARAALPAALFGLGGVLYRYRPGGRSALIAYVPARLAGGASAITYGLARAFGLGTEALALPLSPPQSGVNAVRQSLSAGGGGADWHMA
jgi:malonate transporter and related proteins